MENDIPSKGEIVWFKCCTNGKPIGAREEIPEHMFLILTNTDYNKKSDHFCGLPITSRKKFKYQDFLANYGIDITDEDIEGNLTFEKESYILCDRPVRLNKNDLSKDQKHTGKMKKDMLDSPIIKIYRFFKAGKIS